MRVAKAKRRFLKWERYSHRQSKLISPKRYPLGAAYFNGHSKAYYDYANAHRWVPIGIRHVWLLKGS